MTWDEIAGRWTEVKGKVQQQWGKLTDDDLAIINGKREELAGSLQAKYGMARAEVDREIDAWMKTL